MSEPTRQEWLIKSKQLCGEERFFKYDNCSNANYQPYIPSLYDRQQDLENTKVIETCNEACDRAARPSIFTDRSCNQCGILIGIIVLGFACILALLSTGAIVECFFPDFFIE